MEPGDFKKWRKSLKLSQKEAAHSLGLKRRMIQYYEKGERDGDKVDIPLSVRLACFAIVEGIEDYHGPSRKIKRRDDAPKSDAGEAKPEKVKEKKKDREKVAEPA
ncbi:MAG: helix-turn-helix transcriptional regulator [Parvularculaceae bacterium]|nr:helix-turn-helix transcriptional regulator [Parvularculaceae bacterium]